MDNVLIQHFLNFYSLAPLQTFKLQIRTPSPPTPPSVDGGITLVNHSSIFTQQHK